MNHVMIGYFFNRVLTFRRGFLLVIAAILLAGCVDIRSDVTTATVPRTDPDQLQPWPFPDEQGIINVGGRRYIEARPNESILEIARRIGEDPQTLADMNAVTVNRRLTAGTFVRLPPIHGDVDQVLEQQHAVTEPTPEFQRQESNYIRHAVRPGETAYSIADIYDISVRTLAEWNGLGSDLTVRSGDVLIIPLQQPGSEAVDDDRKEVESPVAEVEPSTTLVVPASEEPPVQATPPVLFEVSNEPDEARFTTPIEGEVIKVYVTSSGHDGIDISAPGGSDVFAVADGQVALVSGLTDKSNIILLRHPDDVYSVYQYVTDVSLKKEDRVSGGEKIAELVDSPGYLHFEIREGTLGVDPHKYFPPGSYSR